MLMMGRCPMIGVAKHTRFVVIIECQIVDCLLCTWVEQHFLDVLGVGSDKLTASTISLEQSATGWSNTGESFLFVADQSFLDVQSESTLIVHFCFFISTVEVLFEQLNRKPSVINLAEGTIKLEQTLNIVFLKIKA